MKCSIQIDDVQNSRQHVGLGIGHDLKSQLPSCVCIAQPGSMF